MATKFFTGGPPVWDMEIGPQDIASGAPVSLTTETFYLAGVHFVNRSATATETLTITDTAGKFIADTQQIPPKGIWQPPAFNFKKCVGIKAGASGPDIEGHLWGQKGV